MGAFMLETYLQELFGQGGTSLQASLRAWREGIDYEVNFWDNWFRTEGAEWQDDFAARLRPQPLAPWLVDLLPLPSGETAKVLDVGSGPITKTGHLVAGREVKVVAVDPLARHYHRIMQKYGVTPPIVTAFAFSEDLSAHYDQDHFDVVCCTNALDHAIEPMWGILEMIIVSKPGGHVFLNHRRNEAVVENYTGFHHWNIDGDGGDFIIWNKQRRLNVSKLLARVAGVEVRIEGEYITVIMTKIAQLPVDPLDYQRKLRAQVLGLLLDQGREGA